MILKQLNNSLKQLINEINERKNNYYDNFINVSLDVDEQYIQIIIDDIWGDAYRYQLSDYNPEWLAEATTAQITEELLKGTKKLYNDLNLLVKNSYTYIENNIKNILENIKECKDASDTFYLVLAVVDNKIMNYMSTSTEYTLSSDEKVTNSITFKESEKFRVLGLDYSGKNSVTYAYSGNTKLLVTVLNQSDDKDKFFEKLQKTYEYLFSNYQYKLALKAGTYTINNENISFDQDIYDLFYEKHSIKDVTYLLMNSKILLFQKYETISANEGTVYADIKNNDSTGVLDKFKFNFIEDKDFSKKSNSEKALMVIDRTKYFATGILAIYSLVFMSLYIMRRVVRKD